MSGAIPPFLQYAFTGWRSVKAQVQLYLYIPISVKNLIVLQTNCCSKKVGFAYVLNLHHIEKCPK
jgi:hypothetical protein